MKRAQTLTVTLGPFFLSLATEGPGSKRKTTEPTMRAAAKSTFILRPEMRSIHRKQGEAVAGARTGRGCEHTVCASCRPGAGVDLGLRRPRSALTAPCSPCAAKPSGRRRRGRGCGWLPRYSPLIGYVPRPPSASRRCAEGGVGIGLRKRLRSPACLAIRPAHQPFGQQVTSVKASHYPVWGWSSKSRRI